MRLWIDAARGVLKRDAVVYFTYRSQIVTQILSLLFNLTVFFFISRLLHAQTFDNTGGYFAYIVVGLAIMQVLIATLGMAPAQVRQELVAGTIERFLVSAFGAQNGMISMMIFPMITAMFTGTILLTLAVTVFGLSLAPTAPLALPVAVLGSLAFMPFAIMLAALVVAFKQATIGTQFVTSGIAIVGGLYFPLAVLPSWIRWTGQVQPFAPAGDLLRHVLVNAPLRQAIIIDLAKLVGFGIVLFPVAMLLLRRAILFAQRRGTIIEY